MNKSELVQAVSDDVGTTKALSNKVLNSILSIVTDALKKGDQIVLPGFGTFAIGNRAARVGRNPQNGKTIQIRASRVAKFRPGKSLKEAVQVNR